MSRSRSAPRRDISGAIGAPGCVLHPHPITPHKRARFREAGSEPGTQTLKTVHGRVVWSWIVRKAEKIARIPHHWSGAMGGKLSEEGA